MCPGKISDFRAKSFLSKEVPQICTGIVDLYAIAFTKPGFA
jgi:hypothetical protein